MAHLMGTLERGGACLGRSSQGSCSPCAESPAWVPLVSLALAFAAYKVGVALKLDYAGKLCAITFVLGAPQPCVQLWKFAGSE